MKDIRTVQIALDTTTESHSINFHSSKNYSSQSVQKRTDIKDLYVPTYLDSSCPSFIEEFAYGNKTLAISKLIHKAHISQRKEYDLDEERIYDELASKGWNDYQEYILIDHYLD